MKRMMRLLSLVLCLMLVQQTAFAAIPEDYVVRHGDRESKKIAITVDDGWNMDAVYKIHELSIELDFPVTWFIVGKLFCAEDRELWEDALAHGDEFGSHTWKHAQLLEYSESSADAQVRLSQERVDEVLGYHYPLRLLRPPFGHYMNSEKNFLPIFYAHGVEKVVLWDVAQTEPYQAFRDTQNGSILLYHARMADYECLKTLIPMLRDAGFEFVTVSDLLGLEPLVLDKPDDAEATDAPEATKPPETTKAPAVTKAPKPTNPPKPTNTPTAGTATNPPKPTSTPDAAQTSNPTSTPEITETPMPTESPEPTETPEPTQSPEPTSTPTPAPTGKLYERVPGIEMPGEKVNGHEYIGTLSIPSLGLKVPVQRNWSYENLSVSPCRYSGSAYADNLAIIAHTYHFGKLSSLALDATVTFTDMENNVFRYVVREKNTISPNDANEIAHSGYDLTLVTCTLSGTKRVAVYCERVK